MIGGLARFIFPATVLVLVAVVVALGTSLWIEQRALATAGNENAQWTVLQLDTEFANLRSVLLEEASRYRPDSLRTVIQTQITLSRIDLVSHGIARDIIESDSRALELLEQLEKFAEEASRLTQNYDAPVNVSELADLATLYQPAARELALLGITIGAERTEARRQKFSSALRNAGLVAISVVFVLAAVLLFLYRSLQISRERDLALRETTGRLESTVSASLDAIVIGNEKGEIVEFNNAAERVFGWRKGEVLGKNIKSTILPGVHFDQSDRFDDNKGPNLISGLTKRNRVEIVGTRRNGDEFPAEINVTRVSNAAGDLVAVYLRDISDRKRNEQALLEAKERAERTDRAKSRFLEVMSHEMRTPLTGILGVLDLLKTTDLTERQNHFLEVAAGSGEVLLEQINEALDITRIESGALVLSPVSFNPHEKVSQVVAVLEALAAEKGLKLDSDLEPSLFGTFIADEVRFGQIVTNLVGNAIKFTSTGIVSVRMKFEDAKQARNLVLTVSDTGDGIPTDQLEEIFGDYVTRAPVKGRLSRGDGLGLSISRRIARLMGGDITVDSHLGHGSHFTLKLPQMKVEEQMQKVLEDDHTASNFTLPNTKKLSVLVVEDNVVNNSVLCEMLNSLGHRVHSATSAADAYKMATSMRFDVILMDVGLPDIDGCELTKMIRNSKGLNRYCRIHGLSAYNEEALLKRAFAVGMNGYTTKPIRLSDLKRVLLGEPIYSNTRQPSTSLIDSNILQELGGTLGVEQMRKAILDFFQEMSDFFLQHEKVTDLSERSELSSHLHKLNGAAALFGFRSLTKSIETTRIIATKADVASLEIALGRLKKDTKGTREQVDRLQFPQSL